MACNMASAHDIEVANSDGKTIYYKINGSYLSVTYQGTSSSSYSNEYTGTVVIPETVTYSGQTYSVTRIGYDAFSGCSGLASVTIGNSVTRIEDGAFSGCSGLTSVTIPNSVTSIGSYAFYETAWYDNQPDGLVYAGNVAYKYKGTMPDNTSITLKEGTVGIASLAFYRCSGLTSVTIPNSVTSIGSYAFRGCSGLTSVTIPNSVTSIGFEAFQECRGLTSVTIPNSVTSIDECTFYDCSGLTSVTIPNSVTSIGSYAFSGCSGLTSVTIPNSVTRIEDGAFSGCSGLTSVTIPNSVTSIGSYAFKNCSGLTSVTIGNSVTSIGSYAFYNTRIKSLTIGTGIQSIASDAFSYQSSTYGAKPEKVIWLANTPPSGYKDVRGTIINYVPNNSYSGLSNMEIYPLLSSMFEVDGIKYVPVSTSERTCAVIDYVYKESTENINIVIPENVTYSDETYGVTSIGKEAFSGCSGLTSVTIPNSVTSIGPSAFSGCSGLQKVIVPNIKNWCSIKFSNSTDNPLYYAHHLYSDENTEITELVIPDDVTSISSYAFYNTRIKSLTIGTGIQTIASQAFSYSITNGAAIGAYPVKVIWLANTPPSGYSSIGGKINYVPNDSYSGLSNTKIYPFLSSMFEVDGIKYVPVSPSERTCDAIDCVYNESAENTKIGNTVTYKNITMTVKNVGDSICSGNTFIKELDYSYNGGILSKNFSGCSNITSITIGSGVKRMTESAFSDCKNITSVTWNAKNYPAFSSYSSNPFYNIRTQITEFIIGDNVTSVPAYMCYGMSSLKSINIPNSVTSIGSSAFYGCSGLEKAIVPNINIKNWCSIKFDNSTANPLSYAHHLYSDDNTEITKLVIPDDVTSINYYAFSGCSGLTSVTIPNSVTSIGEYAFSGCSGLKKNIVPDIKNWCSITFGNPSANPLYYAHHLYSDDNTEITKLVIPDDVTSIGYSAFSGCSGMTSVTIPNSVTNIGEDSFSGCSGLTSVTIPNSVTNIGSYAFNSCSGLNSVTIGNSVTSIGSTIFSGCSSLTSVRFENSKDNTPIVLENNKVFSDCPLDEVYIGRKLSYTKTSSAGYSPFYRNTTLRSVKFTDKETEISDYEFYGCTNLTDVSMGDGVKSIGAYAFSGCSSLEHFTCGRQLESIGKEAFSDCTSMTKFRTRAAVPPTCGAQALDDINKWECTLYVPTESIDDYQAADQWKNFFFIEKFRVEGDSNGDDTVTMADANAIVNYFLAKGTDGFVEGDFDEEAADVNGDGEVTMADANQVVNMFLGGGQ